MRKSLVRFFFLLSLILSWPGLEPIWGQAAGAVGPTFTYEGYLTDESTNAAICVDKNNGIEIKANLRVFDSGTCRLYEKLAIPVSPSCDTGYFTLNFGDSSLEAQFKKGSGATCLNSGTSASGPRTFSLQFSVDGGTSYPFESGLISFSWMPYAASSSHAQVADLLGTLKASDVLTKPPNACGTGQMLTYKAAGLMCTDEAKVGTVTGVTAEGPIGVTNGTTAPRITIQTASSTQAGAISATDWQRFNEKLDTTSTFSGDVTGTSQSTSVTKIRGRAVAETAPTSGQVLRWDGSSYVPTNFGISHLLSQGGGAQFSQATCSSYQTLTWSSLTDTFSCTNIGSLDAAVLSTGTIANERLPSSATVWQVGTGSVSYSSGKVGIGTTIPQSSLDIQGSVSHAVRVVTSNYTLTADDYLVTTGNTALSDDITFTLPSATAVKGRVYTIKKTEAAEKAINVMAVTGQAIDGITSGHILYIKNDFLTIISDGTGWQVLNSSGVLACPSHMLKVGFGGGAFCIEKTTRDGTLTYMGASHTCRNTGARLCTASEFALACSLLGVGTDFQFSNFEWAEEVATAPSFSDNQARLVKKTTSCGYSTTESQTYSALFRCCFD